MHEHADYRRLTHLDGLELLHATFVTHSFAPHTHDHYVIGLIERGVETYTYRGERVTALPGQLILVNPGEVHTGEAGASAGWTYRTLYPTPHLVERATGGLPYFKETVVSDAQTAERLRSFHASAWHGTRLEQEERLLDLLMYLFSRHADVRLRPTKMGSEHKAIVRARAYLDAHAAINISLSELADIAQLSPYYLTRTFKRQLGLTPHAYQLGVRLQLAKDLLAGGKASAEVAAETGFYDQSHFGFHFKRFVGVPPRQYQRSLEPR